MCCSFFQKILSMRLPSSTFQFTSSEELNYCDICLTDIALPFPRHPSPCPAWSIPNSKHRFLAVHVSCYQSCFPLSTTISCTPSTSLTARKHSPQILYHTPVYNPSDFSSFLQTLLPLEPIHRVGKRKWSHSPWLYLLPSTIQHLPFPCY